MKFNIKEYKIDKDKLAPSLIYRGIFYLVLVSLLAFSILFIFPIQEKLHGEAFIYSSGIPARVKSPSQGKLYLKVKNYTKVVEGQLLGTIGWNVSENDLAQLDEIAGYELDYQDPSSLKTLRQLVRSTKQISAEDLISYISAVDKSIEQFNLLKSTNDPKLILKSILQEIDQKQSTLNEVEASRKPLTLTQDIYKDQLDADKQLYADGVISQRDYESAKTKMAEAEQRLYSLQIQKQSIREEMLALQSDQKSLQSKYKSLLSSYQLKIYDKLESYETYYRSEISKRIFRSSMAGKVEIDPYINDQTEIANNTEILKVVPSSKSKEDRKFVLVPNTNIGDVRPGQKVFIELSEYNASDYGYLEARVISRSDIPYNEKYLIDIDLNPVLKTSMNIDLPEQSLYKGSAEIMLKKKSIAQSIWDEVYLKHRKLRR